MIAVTIVNIVAVLLTFLSRYKNFRYGFEIAILVLIIFFGVRYNYGNDYPGYYDMFNEINSYHTLTIALGNMGIEDGWIVLNRLFAPLGFYVLVFCLTIFQFGSLYFFLKKYVKREQLFFVMFLYLFSSNLMLTMLSMMRQCLAMNIILWAIPFILDRKYIKAIILILLAAQFHQSAYILLFLLFVPFLQKMSYKVYVTLMLCLFAFLFIASNTVGEQLAFIVDSYFEKYNEYIGGNKAELGSGIGFIFTICAFLLLLFYDKHDNSNKSFFMKNLAISYLFIPLGFIVQLIARVATYFDLSGISGYLGLVQGHSGWSKLIGYVFLVLFCLFTIYGYFSFFYSDVWHDAFYEYHTIFGII